MARLTKNSSKWHRVTIKERHGKMILMGHVRDTQISVWCTKGSFAFFCGEKTLRKLAREILKRRRVGKPAQVTQPSGWPGTCLRQWRTRLSRVPLAARGARIHRDSCRVSPGGQGIHGAASAAACIHPIADPRRTRQDIRWGGRAGSRHSESRPSGRGVFPGPGPASSAHSTSARTSA